MPSRATWIDHDLQTASLYFTTEKVRAKISKNTEICKSSIPSNCRRAFNEYLAQAGDDAELPKDAGPKPAAVVSAAVAEKIPDALEKLRSALGGRANIVKADPAAKTRLLVTLKDRSLIDAKLAETAGFAVFQPKDGDEIQVLVGLYPERFRALV